MVSVRRSLDEEVAAGRCPEAGAQWLDVSLEIGGKWCRTLLGLMFFCVREIGSGAECSLSRSVDDTELWAVVSTPEGWGATKWTWTGLSTRPGRASANSSARSCTWAEATPISSTDWGMKGLSAALLKKTWECWWMGS